MLRNLPKLLHIREMPEIQAVRIYLQGGGYRNGRYSGRNRRLCATKRNAVKAAAEVSHVRRTPEKMATPAQAKKLRALGYRVRTGKRWKKPTLGDITRTIPYTASRITDSKAEW